MAEKAEGRTDSIKILGQDLELTVKTNGDAVVNMKKADFDAVLEEKGVTKEVRKVVQKAHDDIAQDVLRSERDWLLKINKGVKENDPKFVRSVEARLGGTGDGSMAIKLTGHKAHNGVDLKTHKPYTTHKWGTASITINYSPCPEMRKEGGLLDELSKQFEKAIPAK